MNMSPAMEFLLVFICVAPAAKVSFFMDPAFLHIQTLTFSIVLVCLTFNGK